MSIILIAITAFAVSQTIKISTQLFQAGRLSWDLLGWELVWAGGFPSSHSAVIGATITAIAYADGYGLLFGLSVIVGILAICSLLESRKRELLYEGYFSQSSDGVMKKIIVDQKLLEFSGHTLVEIVAGLTIGVLIAVLGGSVGFVWWR